MIHQFDWGCEAWSENLVGPHFQMTRNEDVNGKPRGSPWSARVIFELKSTCHSVAFSRQTEILALIDLRMHALEMCCDISTQKDYTVFCSQALRAQEGPRSGQHAWLWWIWKCFRDKHIRACLLAKYLHALIATLTTDDPRSRALVNHQSDAVMQVFRFRHHCCI